MVFDSHEAGGWNALYMTAVAEVLENVDTGREVFAHKSLEQGLREWTHEDVLPPARHRLYRATVAEHFVPGRWWGSQRDRSRASRSKSSSKSRTYRCLSRSANDESRATDRA